MSYATIRAGIFTNICSLKSAKKSVCSTKLIVRPVWNTKHFTQHYLKDVDEVI